MSCTDLFFLLQAQSAFITIILLILAKRSYPWCSAKRVITESHRLHDIRADCLTKDYKNHSGLRFDYRSSQTLTEQSLLA